MLSGVVVNKTMSFMATYLIARDSHTKATTKHLVRSGQILDLGPLALKFCQALNRLRLLPKPHDWAGDKFLVRTY